MYVFRVERDCVEYRIAAGVAALALFTLIWLGGCHDQVESTSTETTAREVMKTEEQWREQLTPEQYHVMREAGTEPAFSGKYWDHKEDGVYRCAGCGAVLFDSKDKFESGTGWPSYTKPAEGAEIEMRPDNTLFTTRTEVLCQRCGAHLGHVFEDGPEPTGLRYCMNSVALHFEPRK